MRIFLGVFAVCWAWNVLASEWKAVPTSSGIDIQLPNGSKAGSLALGPVVDVVAWEQGLYAALEAGGVAVVSVEKPQAPVLVGKFAEGRKIAQLVRVEGALWLLENRVEVVAFDIRQPLAPVAMGWKMASGHLQPALPLSPSPVEGEKPASMKPQEPIASFRVIDVQNGRVIVDAGKKQGFLPGTKVKIISQRMEMKPDLETGGATMQSSNETTAVLLVEQAQDNRAMAMLGRGDVAEKGDVAVLTEEALSERLWLPRRSPFRGRAGFHLRPFLGVNNLNSKPVGFLADVYASYYFDNLPLQVEVTVAPFGTVWGGQERHNPVVFSATASYATDYFEIGLGVGGLAGRAGPCDPFSTPRCESNTGWTINQVLRLGAIDGLNFQWKSSIFSRTSQFVFGVGRGELNVPVNRRLGLFGSGGGGENGWAFGEFGIRSYVGGTGTKGTHIVSASLGVASIFDGANNETVTGPAVALGWETRW